MIWVFGLAQLVSYVSGMVTLDPGNVIASDTPGGVGHARKPPRYLGESAKLVTWISGLGELMNVAKPE